MKQDNPDIKSEEDHTNRWLCVDYDGGVRYSFDHTFDIENGFCLALQLDTLLASKPSLEWCHAAFDRLEKDRECVEKELGALEWEREWQGKWGSHIVSYYPYNFYDLLESADDIHAWAAKQYQLFRKVFDPKTEKLDKLNSSDD